MSFEPDKQFDVLVVGAGPTGLACGIAAKQAGLKTLIVEKGCLVNSILHYPTNMTFFTSRELLEIGGIPFTSLNLKPTRSEALEYYRCVTDYYHLPVQLQERVNAVQREGTGFRVQTTRHLRTARTYQARKVILATGYYDQPNLLHVRGEDLPKVAHYYTEPHPFYQQKVAVVGGGNSAAEAALDLHRHGAEVTLIHRARELSSNLKYWIKPDIENRIKEGSIKALFECQVREIREHSICVQYADGQNQVFNNDFVFALVGYHPDYKFLRKVGVTINPDDGRPQCHLETLESNVRGLYLAGVIIAGKQTNEIFIENGRLHGQQIVADIVRRSGTQ